MGRPFATELANIPKTIEAINKLDLEGLPKQIAQSHEGPVFIIGTGGSLTSAEFCKRLFDQHGVAAQVITPLEFLHSRINFRGSSVFILSAGGNNKDILAAFNSAVAREAKHIINICAARNSRLARAALSSDRAFTFDFTLPGGRDGYLATNSLIATCLILARAFGDLKEYVADADLLLTQGKDGFHQTLNDTIPEHYIVMFSGWSRPAAIDLESKLSEAGLAGSMLSDFRHFAHGRHNWLDKKSAGTAMVAFTTLPDEKLAKKTLDLLPSSTRKLSLHTSKGESSGALDLLLNTFGFVAAAGEFAGIDPGRPKVPPYGSRIYQLGPGNEFSPSKTESHTWASAQQAAINRKIATAKGNETDRSLYLTGLTKFSKNLHQVTFGALVADFDGTILAPNSRNGPINNSIVKSLIRLLRAKIPIYFATGRGDSVNELLKKTFPQGLWKLVNVAYLNGAFCLPLSECSQFENFHEKIDVLSKFYLQVKKHHIISRIADVKDKGHQVSFFLKNCSSLQHLINTIQELLADSDFDSLRLTTSSHSIDVIPTSVSKVNCIKVAKSAIASSSEVLTIGDCGAYPGNDFELLQHPFSLSVDAVSGALDTCWNILPEGISHTHGTAFYLSQITAKKSSFHFTL